MTISLQTLETLEFPKVRERLAAHTAFSASRELALELLPSTDAIEVARALRQTTEARRLLDDYPDVSVGGARDVRPAAGHARRGGTLEGSVLLEVAATLASMRLLRNRLQKLGRELFPQLNDLAEALPILTALEDLIAKTIGDDGGVLDNASPALARLRAEVRIAFGRLQDKLHSMISSSQSESLQEPIITVRNGRYVVPVKASHRRNIRGLVHDQSASGATLYIEPMAVVELNNRWRELQIAEEQEVARILAELSDKVGDEASSITHGVEALADIDLAFAKAKYALALRCVEPQIIPPSPAKSMSNDAPPGMAAPAQNASHRADSQQPAVLRFSQARHPLLDQQMVVPIDMQLGGSYRLLLITGPNTGGKTVALKTTGLLTLMAQAGMHIPASEPAHMPIFGQIFADIGDEQSIEQSLSTFSSHMTNIIRILRALDDPARERRAAEQQRLAQQPNAQELETLSNWRKSTPGEWEPLEALTPEPQLALVLLDELGAGTDPVEGAALARAIIERLLERDVLGVATTHYAELKAFAYSTPGVTNGSVEFNVETLAPTYKLTIGLPGRSNALAIAARLGLHTELIDRARSSMAHEDAQVEDLLAGIHHEREAAAADMQRAQELRDDAEKYRDRLQEELYAFESRREAEWEAAQAQIESELREARGQIRRLRDELRSVSVSRQWLEDAEKRLDEARASIPEAPQPNLRPAVPTQPAQAQQPRPIQPGDTVLVRSVGLSGEVISIDEEEQAAEVQVGGFRMRAELAELQRQKGGDSSKSRSTAPSSLSSVPNVSLDFDMRGWRAADVPDRLDRYLNDAYLAGMPLVRLIHGKGTGALRQVVRDSLKGHKLVASYTDANPAEGGAGVTVVRLQEQ